MPLLALTMLAPGPALFGIYEAAVRYGYFEALGLFAERKDLAILIAGYCFTMLGFMAAVITILFVFVNSRTFKLYVEKGHFDLLLVLYFLAIITLFATALLTLFGFSARSVVWPFRLMMMGFIDSIFCIAVFLIAITNLARSAAKEPEGPIVIE